MTCDPGRLRPLVEEAGALVPGVQVAVGLVRAPPPRPARAAVAPVATPSHRPDSWTVGGSGEGPGV